MTQKKTLHFVDVIKAISMISVYLLHSEAYYGTGGFSYGYLLQPFYVNAFFFISGYLFFRKHLEDSETKDLPNNSIETYRSILFKIVVPTILFSTIIYIPKLLFHNKGITINGFLIDIFGGISFWFTSALAISQLLLISLLLLQKRSVWFYTMATLVIFLIVSFFTNRAIVADGAASYFPWFYKTGLSYTFFMCLGGLYLKYEDLLDKIVNKYIAVISIIYLFLLYIGYNYEPLKLMGLSARINALGFIAIVCGISLIVYISKKINNLKILEFIGRNSIVFYFMSGVAPATIGKLAGMFLEERSYIITVVVAGLSITTSYFITLIINRYFKWLTDLRLLRLKNTAFI